MGMSAASTLLHLAGYVALLLWGMHMVHSGMVRAYGARLRHALSAGLHSRWKAFAGGLCVTALLQSSTATTLMSTSFIAGGFMALTPALAVTLGANVGTTLIVQLVTFNVVAFAPIFILVGVIAFKWGGKTRSRDLARVSIGIGMILLALHLLLGALQSVERSQYLRDLFALLHGDIALHVLLGALLTWMAYSSIAVILLVMSLASEHIVTSVGALALVLGANLGGIIPQYLAAGSETSARQLALGNLVMRGVGCAIAVPCLTWLATGLAALEGSAARQVADFHTLFNVAVAVAFLGILGPVARLCARVLPGSTQGLDAGKPQYIDPKVVGDASIALANAAREMLRMVDIVDSMLRMFIDAIRNDDRKQLQELSETDNTLDSLQSAIKLHLTALSRSALGERDAKRCADTLALTINLEHVGDILDKSLREIASKKIKQRLSFSSEGLAELEALHARVRECLALAVSVFLTRDLATARALLSEKERFRELEREAIGNHWARLRQGRQESLETSSLHIDIVRDLKRIGAHIASVAYPILEEAGALRSSRIIEGREFATETQRVGGANGT